MLPHLDVEPRAADAAAAAAPPSAASSISTTAALRPRASVAVLIVGCGNSELSSAMYQDGFTSIDSVDYSQVVIDKMSAAHRHLPQLRFLVQDVRAMTFAPQSYDVIVDKGTLDAILCGAESNRHATAMLSECHRVLKDDGRLLIITYGQPTSRLSYLEQTRYGWDVTYEVLGGTRYLYVCRKHSSDARDAVHPQQPQPQPPHSDEPAAHPQGSANGVHPHPGTT